VIRVERLANQLLFLEKEVKLRIQVVRCQKVIIKVMMGLGGTKVTLGKTL
jgi:hypothetical protein